MKSVKDINIYYAKKQSRKSRKELGNDYNRVKKAIERGEGTLSSTGALVVTTGKYTGRSPEDKFIVDTEAIHDSIAWGKVNKPISKENLILFIQKLLLIYKIEKFLFLMVLLGLIQLAD